MNRKLLYAEMFLPVVLPRVQLLVVAEREARLMIMQCGVEIWANLCMYVCKMSCYWAPHVNYVYEPPPAPGQSVTCILLSNFTRFVAALIWRDTDGKAIERGEWTPASRRRTYVAPSVWGVNPSSMIKKLKNTSSKQTFDSIYRY